MFRKHNPNNRAKGSPGKWGKEPQQRKVSPNYTVNLMAHNSILNPNGQSPQRNPRGGQPQGGRPHGRPVGVYQPNRGQSQRGPSQRPPFRHTPEFNRPRENMVEIEEGLYKTFEEKLKARGRSAEEGVNRLVSLFNEGKISLD